MHLDLAVASANPHWHVPSSVQSLIGELYVARKVFDLWQPYLHHRLSGQKEHSYERGIATSLIVHAGLIAERSLKSLVAQTQSQWAGTNKHDLWILFELLSHQEKVRIKTQFQHPSFASQWSRFVGPDDTDVENIINTTRHNFVEWRYTMERSRTGNGLPGPLLKVGAAVVLVCIWHLLTGQHGAEVTFPINELPFSAIPELN